MEAKLENEMWYQEFCKADLRLKHLRENRDTYAQLLINCGGALPPIDWESEFHRLVMTQEIFIGHISRIRADLQKKFPDELKEFESKNGIEHE